MRAFDMNRVSARALASSSDCPASRGTRSLISTPSSPRRAQTSEGSATDVAHRPPGASRRGGLVRCPPIGRTSGTDGNNSVPPGCGMGRGRLAAALIAFTAFLAGFLPVAVAAQAQTAEPRNFMMKPGTLRTNSIVVTWDALPGLEFFSVRIYEGSYSTPTSNSEFTKPGSPIGGRSYSGRGPVPGTWEQKLTGLKKETTYTAFLRVNIRDDVQTNRSTESSFCGVDRDHSGRLAPSDGPEGRTDGPETGGNLDAAGRRPGRLQGELAQDGRRLQDGG